jgi:hypothetical protein
LGEPTKRTGYATRLYEGLTNIHVAQPVARLSRVTLAILVACHANDIKKEKVVSVCSR